MFKSVPRKLGFLSLFTLGLVSLLTTQFLTNSDLDTKSSFIISSKNYEQLEKEILSLGIQPTHHLKIINAFVADITKKQLMDIANKVDIQYSMNHGVSLTGASGGWKKGQRRWQPEATVPQYIGATQAHSYYNFGDSVTIGFLDTGLDQLTGLSTDLYGRDKAWGTYDAINNSVHNYDDEDNGHGTHVASIASNSDFDVYGKIYGVAPNAATVGIKAFDYEGKATYADVIRGIEWAIQVKDQINLKILNMSFSGPVRSYYWEDPLNQAVMKAWQAGIVVVASAGNTGPTPMSIGVPGNVPYIITVGAMTDDYTTSTISDDKVATFSSAGPTFEAFVKPEIIAPGGHLSGLMSYDSQIVMDHPEYHDGGRYFEMSGTSQAAAVVSGVIALMLTDEPNLSPDDVKCRLMSSANTAKNDDGSLAFSIFQQGAGVVNASGALQSTEVGCANVGLNIDDDLNDIEHFYGSANIDNDGNFYIEGLGDEYVWKISEQTQVNNDVKWQPNVNIDRLVWKAGLEVDRLVWKANIEFNQELLGVDRLVWKADAQFDSTESILINHWVDQQ